MGMNTTAGDGILRLLNLQVTPSISSRIRLTVTRHTICEGSVCRNTLSFGN